MPNKIYITDTSALYFLISGKHDFNIPETKRQRDDLNRVKGNLIRLFDDQNSQIVIPMPALIELLGNYFHSSIQLERYDEWYSRRRKLINQHLLLPLYSPTSNVRLQHSSKSSENIAQHLVSTKIPENICMEIQGHYSAKPVKYDRDPKLFDGMDAAIIAIAVQVALQHPNTPCHFVSRDNWLRYGTNYVRNLSCGELANLSFISPFRLP